jgi:hypothetical protein
LVSVSWHPRALLQYIHLSIWTEKQWHKHANFLILMINCTKLLVTLKKINKVKRLNMKNFILLLLLNNLFLVTMLVNGCKNLIFHKDLLDTHHALEKKLVLMEEILTESSESINLKRLNNLLYVTQMSLLTCIRKWLLTLKNSWDYSEYLSELY